jgi:hypothetical protein
LAVSKYQTPETNPIHPRESVRPWGDILLIEMVPKEYRTQVQAILNRDPNAYRILEHCKSGSIDCWEVLDLLGIAQPDTTDSKALSEGGCREAFEQCTAEIAEHYREGTRAFIEVNYPELAARLQVVDDEMIAAWRDGNSAVFKQALARWQELHMQMISAFSECEKCICRNFLALNDSGSARG